MVQHNGGYELVGADGYNGQRWVGWLRACLHRSPAQDPPLAQRGDQTKRNFPQEAPKSLDTVYEEIKQRIASQQQQLTTLDSKANFGLGSSTLLTAVIAFQDFAQSARLSGLLRSFITLAVFGALLLYLRTVCAALEAYRTRKYVRTGDPATLQQLLPLEEHIARLTLIEDWRDAYDWNQGVIDSKAAATNTMFRCLLYQALLVSALVALRTIL